MKRSTCALGLVVVGLWLARDPIAAEEGSDDEAVGEPVPAAPEPAPPAAQGDRAPAREVSPAFTVFGELLFLKPTLDDTYFVIRSSEQGPPSPSPVGPSGQRKNDEFDLEPAFQIGARYEFADSGRGFELDYTRLDAEATESVSGDFLWATRGTPDFNFAFGPNTGGYTGSASADIDATYQRIDVLVTQPWHVSGLDLGIQFGLEWADFRVGEEYVYVDNGTNLIGRVSAASRSSGVGPALGLGLGYELGAPWNLPGSFSVRAGSSVGLLLSETHTRTAGVLVTAPVFGLRDDEASRVLTAIHARFGVTYELPLADRIAATIGAGYEIDTYLRGLTRVEFVDDVGKSLAKTTYDDFDLQGLYASFGVVF
jgi:hypothetical protein